MPRPDDARESLDILPSFAVSIKHPNMQRFDRLPFSKVFFSTELFFIAGFVFGSFYAIAWSHLSTSKPAQFWQNLAVVIIMTALLFVFTHLLRTLSHRRKCRATTKDRPSEDNAFFVALSYSKGKAIVDDLDWAWDQGWLRSNGSVLIFDGVSTQFELPLNAIVETRFVLTDPLRKWADRLILVEWRTAEGNEQHIMLEPRDAKSYRLSKYRNIELLAFLQERRMMFHEAHEMIGTYMLPYPSTRSLEAFIVDGKAATTLERTASYAFGAMSMLAVGVSFLAINPHPEGIWRYLPGVIGAFLYGRTAVGLRHLLVRRRYLRKGLFSEQISSLELT